jgi:hypothetical protein
VVRAQFLLGSFEQWCNPHGLVLYEPKMVAHICFMFKIYLELHLKLLLKQLKVLKRVGLGVELCFKP